MSRPARLINPAEYARQKQFLESKLTDAEVDRYALPAWIYLGIVMSGKACEGTEGGITRHIVMLQVFAAEVQDRPLYELTAKTVTLWLAALDLSMKRREPVDLSTSAKKAISKCISEWERALRAMNTEMLLHVCNRWRTISRKYTVDVEEKAA